MAPAIDPLAEIAALVAFDGRAPGSDTERRAATHLARRLEALGRDAELEPFWTWPRYASAHLFLVTLALVGSVVSVFQALVGLVIVAVAVVATVLDLTGRTRLTRRTSPRRASQNVLSREEGGRPGTLVLVAHYDAAPTGLLFSSGLLPRLAAIGRVLRVPLGATHVLVALLLAVLVCTVLRPILEAPFALDVVQVVLTALLVLVAALLAGIVASPTVPGANDNASGVATALALAESHSGGLEHFDLWILLTGADEGLLLGADAFVRAHRRELDPRRTLFVGLDRVGLGSVRYARREGLTLPRRYYGPLLALCERIASEDSAGRHFGGARSAAPPSASSVHAAARRGYPAVAISCALPDETVPGHHLPSDTPDRIELEALRRAIAFSSKLLERVDAELGPAVAALGDPETSRWRRRFRRLR